jgi:para-nitrobenzyl esterase
VGCEGGVDVLACLRAAPAEALVLAPGFVDVHPKVGGLVLPDAPIRLIADQAATIPLLIGSDREESTYFSGDPYRPQWFAFDTGDIVGPQASRIVRTLYPVDEYDSPGWAANAFFSDAIWTCPIRRLALASSGPVYRYLYTHRLEHPFLSLLRSAHFLEEPILWHDASLLEGFGAADYAFTAADDLLSDQMATYWTNFARTGDPNGPGVPTWPSYEAGTEQVVALSVPLTVLERYHVAQCEFFDTVPDLFLPAQFLARYWVAPRHGPIPS